MARLNALRAPTLPPQGGLPPRSFEPSNTLRTHEGGVAATISPLQALRRSVSACLLWESEFYEDGRTIADRIVELATQVTPVELAALAVDVRSHLNLRHAPLLLAAVLARTGRGSRLVGDTIAGAIQRADELAEFLAVYARLNGVAPSALKPKLSAQVKRGLALAFRNFDAYQLAKYDRAGPVRLRDALFLCHAKPVDEAQDALWKALIAGTLPTPDTWEVGLSAALEEGVTKVERDRGVFTRLLTERKLGYLALLRNLRNMVGAGVDRKLVIEALVARRGADRVLPFRYVAAARACPELAPTLDQVLTAAIALDPLPGRTAVLVDVSGSMTERLSARSDLTRMDAAAALAAILPGEVDTFSFSNYLAHVGETRGLGGIDMIIGSQGHQGTALGEALRQLPGGYDRLVVITDEQASDHVAAPSSIERCYLINVASARNGVGYGPRWVHLDGFSERVIRWIGEYEALPPVVAD